MSEPTKRRLFFLIIGALLLALSYAVTDSTERTKFWPTTVQNVALIALTVVIIEVLWSIVGGDPVNESIKELRKTLSDFQATIRLLDDSHTTGLRRIHPASVSVVSDKWMDLIRRSTKSIDLMGYTLLVWTRSANFEETITGRVIAGTRVRILLMHLDNPDLSAFVNDENIPSVTIASVRADITASIQAFTSIKVALPNNARGSLELRAVRSGLIVTQLCRTDETLMSIQYLYSAVASRSPLMEVQGAALFRVYMDEFEHLWTIAEPLD